MERLSSSDEALPLDQSHATTPNRKPLSCVSCRQRKIKCDRVHPCVHCQKSNTPCVFPARVRANRPKHGGVGGGKRDSELLQRIARLESLVGTIDAKKIREQTKTRDGTFQRENLESMPFLGPSAAAFVDGPEKVSPARTLADTYASFVNKQSNNSAILGGDFWSTLTDEVGGIRQLLEHDDDDDDDEDEHTPGTDASPDTQNLTPNFVFGASSREIVPEYHPSLKERKTLFEVYLRNVHPVVKVLHAPTGRLHLLDNDELKDQNTGDFKFPSMKAITFACGLLAIVSMNSEECFALVGHEKDAIRAKYKRGAEVALSQADFMNSVEILTLQALLLYILALRTIDRGRTSWTFIAIAIRIAHGMGLHKDDSSQYFTSYEAEMRRRIWWQILVLDMRAADDRGSEPMILDGSFNTSMPSNVIEDDFSPLVDEPLKIRIGFTDITAFLISCDTANIARRLASPSLSPDRQSLTLQEKEALVKGCAERIETQYLAGCDMSHPLVSMIFMSGRFLILKLWTLVQYPIRNRDPETRKFPRSQALRTVTAVLQIAELQEDNPLSQNLLWFFQSWVPWHPLAVALVELCSETRGELADKAWAIIEKGYPKWSTRVSGMSWRPVRRLYRKALAARHAAQAEDRAKLEQQTALDPPADVIPELPALSLDPTIQGSSFYFSAVNTGQFAQNAPLPWDVDFLPDMDVDLPSGDGFVDTNWDNWNDFVYDIHAFDGQDSS